MEGDCSIFRRPAVGVRVAVAGYMLNATLIIYVPLRDR
jgi:hypothetical protein